MSEVSEMESFPVKALLSMETAIGIRARLPRVCRTVREHWCFQVGTVMKGNSSQGKDTARGLSPLLTVIATKENFRAVCGMALGLTCLAGSLQLQVQELRENFAVVD
jgi:hypothetical protein